MRKTLVSVAVASVLGLWFTGCAGGSAAPINLTSLTKKEVTLDNQQLGLVEKGSLTLKDGKKIFDSEGDIVTSFDKNGKLYYIVKSLVKDESQFKVKDSNKKLIHEFKANAITWFEDVNRFVIATKLERNSTSSIYDNVYEFDGAKFNLVNKNLDLRSSISNRTSISGLYKINSLYNNNSLRNQVVTNIITGKEIRINEIKTNFEVSSAAYRPIIFGIRNDIVYYIYREESGANLVEAYDIKDNKVYTLYAGRGLLFGGDYKMQFLQSGKQVALRVLENTKLMPEISLSSVATKYQNEPAKIISLNTLEEIKGLTSNFKLIPTYQDNGKLDITFGGESFYYRVQSMNERNRTLF